MWQSCVEIKNYCKRISIALLCLNHWTSVKGGAHTCFIDGWMSNESTKRIWAPPLMEVQRYGILNAAVWRDRRIFDFYMGCHIHLLVEDYLIDWVSEWWCEKWIDLVCIPTQGSQSQGGLRMVERERRFATALARDPRNPNKVRAGLRSWVALTHTPC